MSDLIDIKKTIDQMNQQITGVNSTLANYAQEVRKNPILLQKQTAELKNKLQEVLGQPEKTVENKSEVKIEGKEENTKIAIKGSPDDYSVTALWGDSRLNPYFLQVADYFGLKEKDYRDASSKINTIVDWAANESKSKNIADIISKIGKTAKTLQSPGFGERRYAIMYRYVKLSGQTHQAASQQDRDDLKKRMSAYET